MKNKGKFFLVFATLLSTILRVLALDPATNDVWDVSAGTIVVANSNLGYGTSSADMFGAKSTSYEPGSTLFSDSAPADGIHFVEWQTANPVAISSFSIFAAGDGEIYQNEREFSRVTIKTKSSPTSDFDTVIYDLRTPHPYVMQEAASLLLTNVVLTTPVVGQFFRAEFLNYVAGRGFDGPRIIELDAFGDTLPIAEITRQPSSQEVIEGAAVMFSVEADSTLALQYQWFFNGTAIVGATNSTLLLTHVTQSSVGVYLVKLANARGTISSTPAILKVDSAEPDLVVNVDFTAHLNPAFRIKTGLAATGRTESDYWNVYSRDLDSAFNWRSGGSISNLLTAAKAPTLIDLSVNNAAGAWASDSADAMMQSYLYSFSGDISLQLAQIPTGLYDLYVYAHGLLPSQNAAVDLIIGDRTLDEKSTSSESDWNPATWLEGHQYVVFRSIPVASDFPLNVLIKGGISHEAEINGLQLISVAPLISDTHPPVITINSPTNGPAGTIVNLTGRITDDRAVTTANWWLEGSPTHTLNLTENRFNVFDIPLDYGTNLLHISARDLAGNQALVTLSLVRPSSDSDTNVTDSSNMLVNINFTAHLNPAFSVKTGPAAVGHRTNDFWNVYSRDVDSEYNWRDGGTVANLLTAERQPTGMNLTVKNATGAWYTESDDAMLGSYLYPFGGNIMLQLGQIPNGVFDLYVYAHGLAAQENTVVDLNMNGQLLAERSTSSDPQWDPSTWQIGKQFVVFRSITITSNSTVDLTVKGGVAGLAVINGLQLISPAMTDVDTRPPTVSIVSPASGNTSTRTVDLEGSIADDVGVVSAVWSINEGAPNVLAVTNDRFNLSGIVLNAGTNLIRVVVSDAEGNQSSDSVQVVYRPSIFLSIGSAVAEEGGDVSVPLVLTTTTNVAGITFSLSYDSTLLFDPILSWVPAFANSLTSFNGSASGKAQGAIALLGQGFSVGENSLGFLTFHTRSVPNDRTTALGLSLTGVFDASGTEITSGFGTESGSIEIRKREITGDNNGNNRLDVGDASLIMQFVTSLVAPRPWDLLANDLNHNGRLDLGDVIQVLRVVVGLDPQPKSPKALAARGSFNSTDSGAFKLIASDPSIGVGDMLTVQVAVEGHTGPVSGASFRLQYPTNALRLIDSQSLQSGGIVPTSAAVFWNVSPRQNDFLFQDGSISGAISSGNFWPTNHGTIAVFKFGVQVGVSSEPNWPITLTDGELSDGPQVQSLANDRILLQTRLSNLLSFAKNQEGSAQLQIQGEMGKTYRLEYSTDLSAWTPVPGGIVTLSSGVATVSDSNNSGVDYRFYRVLEVVE